MLVSFIIPAYNAADTILRCLESIRNLTLKKEEYEIIVIDDASTDNTVAVIEDWRLKNEDCSLIILRQLENHRQGAARNRGVSVAKGEYICFIDADDAAAEGIVTAIRMAKEKQMDMAAYHCGAENEKGELNEKELLISEEERLFTGIEMQNRHPYWNFAPWGFVFNKEFLEKTNYSFVEDVLYEDSDFIGVHLYHAKRMSYSKEFGYKALYREGSTTRSTNHKNVADYLLLGERMLRFYKTIEESGKLNEEGVEQFAEGILEGGCMNIAKSCKRIIKLQNIGEVQLYYERIETKINCKDLYKDRNLRKYLWNRWTALCLGYKNIALIVLAVLMPMYRLIKKCKV